MASKYMKKFSTSLVIKEMQIKKHLDFISPQLEWPYSRVIPTTNAGKDVGKQAYTLLVGMQICTISMESSLEIPQKAQDRTAMCFSDTTLGHLPKGI
jgi:hypothetical protein